MEAKERPNGSQDVLLDSQGNSEKHVKSHNFRIRALKIIGDCQNCVTREGDGTGAPSEVKGRQKRGQVSLKGGQGMPTGGQVEAKERPNGSRDFCWIPRGIQ